MPKPEPPNECFERFREMTKRIVSTPKAKVDALAKEWQKRKAQRRAMQKPA
ncbi:MAG TPA: hypothetical protein VLW52_15360 [Opitutaceae bacterium]|nr:hypothetical protein [Opitutaceae bacterium]